MRARIVLVYVAIAFLWGSTWSVIRIGLEDLPPLRFAGVRMALAAALLAPFALRGGAWRVLLGEAGPRIALVGLFQIALPYGLMFVAQQWVPSGLAALLFATFPVWIALLARLVLPGERLTPAKLASAAVGVAGIAVLQARTSDRSTARGGSRWGARSSSARRSSSRSRTCSSAGTSSRSRRSR